MEAQEARSWGEKQSGVVRESAQHCKIMTALALAQQESGTCSAVDTGGALTPLGLVLCWGLSLAWGRFVVEWTKAGKWTCWLSHCITCSFYILGLYFHASFHIKSAPSQSWGACCAGVGMSHPRGSETFSPPLILHGLVILHVGLAQEVRVIQPELLHTPNHSFSH